MATRKDLLYFALLIGILEAVFINLALTKGITSLSGVIEVITFLSLVNAGVIVFVYEVGKRISFEKASEEELKAEDEILLQATAFSQAALWIFLSLTSVDGTTFFLKLLVPSAAILFYSVRAWGKLKNSNKYRYYSVFVFSLVVSFSAYVLLTVFISPMWKGVLFIEGVDITFELIRALAAVPFILPIIFNRKIRTRYGLP